MEELINFANEHGRETVETVNETVNETVKISDAQEKILQLLQNNEDITYEEIAEKMSISRATVGRHISVLKKSGILKRIGEDKNGHWIILIQKKS